LLAGTLLLLCACASVKTVSQKFTPHTKANVGIFADQTISMLSDSDFGFSRNETLYTREFFDLHGQEEKDVRAYREETKDFFIRIIKYSLDLVLIAETKETAQERVAAYTKRVTNMNKDVLKKLEVSPDRYDNIKKQVADSEEFLDALRVGQPIINAAGRYLHQILDRSDTAIDVLSDKIDKKIDDEYAEVIRYQAALEKEKYNILRSLAYLYGAYKGNMEAYAKLSSSESIFRKDLIPDPPPSDEDLSKIAEYLQSRLSTLHVVENEIQSDWVIYRASHRELDTLIDKAKRENTRARMILLVWLRAHQKMASGVLNPAEWYDIKSLAPQLIDLGVSGAKKAI
jgi:hypothetical protein